MWNPFKKSSSYEFRGWEEIPTEAPAEETTAELAVSLEQRFTESDAFSIRLKKAVRGLLLALVLSVPVFFLPFTAPIDALVFNKQILIYGLVLASAILWLIVVVRQGGVRLKVSGLEPAILAYLGANLLAAVFSRQVYHSFISGNGFMALTSLAVFSFLLFNFFEKDEIGKIADYFTVGAFAAILTGVLSLYGVPIFKWISASQLNTVGSVNNLGALAVLVLVLVLARYFSSLSAVRINQSRLMQSRLMQAVKIGTVGFSAVLLLVANWSVFYIVLAVGMAGIIFSLGLSRKNLGEEAKFKAGNLVGPLAILSLSLLLLFSSYFFNFNFPGRQNLPLEVAISQKGSLEVAKHIFSTSSPFGVGQNNFSLVFDQFKPSGVNNSMFWNTRFGNAASGFWNLTVETGAAGLAVFAFLIFSILSSLFRNKNHFRLAGLNAVMPVFLSALALFFLYPFNIVLNFLFWTLIGLWSVAVGQEVREKSFMVAMDEISPRSVLSSLAFVLVIVFGLAGGYLIFKKYQGEIYFSKAARMNLASVGEVDRATELLGRSLNSDPQDTRYLNGLAQLFLTKINLELKNEKDKPEEVKTRLQNLIRLTVQAANQMIAGQPNDAQNWSSAGLVYENLMALSVGGADQAALSAYEEYAKRAPYDPGIYTRIGNVYLKRADFNSNALAGARRSKRKIENEKEVVEMISADYKKAEESYKKAVELKKDLASALYSLGVVYDRQAQTKSAIKQLELTKLLDPNSPGLAFELGLLYYRDGQKDNALAEMARAVNLAKDYANARWYLALILEERGRVDLAMAQLKEILKTEANKDNQTVKDKLASLQAGRRELPPAKVTSKVPLEQSAKPSK